MIVFVTDATAGSGAAITRKFVAEGHRVVAAGRQIDRLDALQKASGTAVFALQLDVTDRAATEAVTTRLPDDFAAIDVLVNNAGCAPLDADLDDWDATIDTDVKGLARMTRSLLPGMVERGRGHIVNVGSIVAQLPHPGVNVDGATNAFVDQFSLNLRADLLGTPVRVTHVEPGRRGGAVVSEASTRDGTQPLTADDIADAVYWVASQPPHVNINSVRLTPV